jgi:hypothetical protein
MFVNVWGKPIQNHNMAALVREHLSMAKITRVDLFSEGKNKGRFGTHCFRRSFVTRSLATGKGEDWTRQRTGHTGTQLQKYRQAAQALAELDLGDIDPLAGLIPEFAQGGTQGGPDGEKDEQLQGQGSGADCIGSLQEATKHEEFDAVEHQKTPKATQMPTSKAKVGQKIQASDAVDPIEQALADALTKAALAGAWDTVRSLTDELQARRRARVGVVPLDAARKRRQK